MSKKPRFTPAQLQAYLNAYRPPKPDPLKDYRDPTPPADREADLCRRLANELKP
jgi:hypothetical protein